MQPIVAGRRGVRRLVFSCLSATAATLGVAQENADEGLAEVVVTAQFRQQSLQDTPLAITAMNAGMLEARSQLSITDITAQAPNVVLKPAPARVMSCA
jgi:iron complex outermembrane receptor protein